MNIASISLCYPSPATPHAGLFVRRRLEALDVSNPVRVICPVPACIGTFTRRDARYTPGAPPVWHVPMGYIPMVSRPLNPLLYARAVQPLLASWARRGEVDIIDAHFSWPDGVAAARLSRWLGVPYAVTLRGVLPRYAGDRLKRWSIARSLRGASAVIAVSQSLKDLAVALGVRADRIVVIPNGVDSDTFHPGDRRSARRALGRSADESLLISVGHLCPRKGMHRVVGILPKLLRRNAGIRYVVVGADGAEERFEGRLKRLVRRLGLERCVTFTGSLDPPEVARWLQASDLFVLPTSNEGCCNAIGEALATGLPVVTTDVGGNRELVSPGAGLLTHFGDDRGLLNAISSMLEAAPQRAEVINSVRQRTWQQVAQRTAEALHHAIGQHAAKVES